MKHFNHYAHGDNNSKLMGILLTPSWLSGLIAIVLGIGVVALTITSMQYRSSFLATQIAAIQAQHEVRSSTYTGVDNPVHGRLLEDLPLIFFWALLGLIVYMFAANIVSGLQKLKELRDSLDYEHMDRRKVLLEAGERFLIRSAVLAIWLPYILFFFHHVVPYCVVTAQAAAAESWYSLLGFSLLSVAVFVLAMHLQVIFLRLLLLKPRALSDVVYD